MSDPSMEDLEALALAYFQNKPLRCLSCEAPAEAHTLNPNREGRRGLMFVCRRKKHSHTWQPPETKVESWSKETKADIVEDYWKRGYVYCPNDRTQLDIKELAFIGAKETELMVWCQFCGRRFNSSELQSAA